MQVRRVVMQDHPNRGDVQWLLFEDGDIAHPLRVLSEFELDQVLDQVAEQRAAARTESRVSISRT